MRQCLTLFAIVSLGGILLAPLCAQQVRVTADIPFEFIVGSTTLPAGEYALLNTFRAGDHLLVEGLSAGLHESARVLSNRAYSHSIDGPTRLVFNRYENRYFLSQIWVRGQDQGWSLLESHKEREAAKQASARPVETLTVLAKR